jgi:Asp/Glu/hydantoin racemase
MTRIALLHTGAVVIPTFTELAANYLPTVEIQHLLDDRIVSDLGSGADSSGIAARLSSLGRAAKTAGADAIVFTCSSISGYARGVGTDLDLPVFRIDEAMADEAVRGAQRISVIATLETTLVPTAALLRERAALHGRTPEISEVVVPGAFAAVAAGDRELHDAKVAQAITGQADRSDVIVLAQASMVSAAAKVDVDVPILTSPELGIRRVADALA